RMSGKHSLRQIQEFMWQAVSRPLNEDYSSKKLWIDGKSFEVSANDFIKPNEKLSSAQRVQIYNQQYWYRLLDCLEDDFPGLRAVLGASGFLRLATEYLNEYPSRSFSLRDLGCDLPEFVDARQDLIAPNATLCGELARFEWAQVVAFDGPSLEPIDDEYIRTANPETLKVSLQPYLTLLELTHALDHYSVALNRHARDRSEAGSKKCEADTVESGGEPAPWPVLEHIYLVVHRHENTVYFKRIDVSGFLILTALSRGQSLSEALNNAVSFMQENAIPLEGLQNDIQKSFALWNRLGWLCKREMV
ncbi:putative DNA-binding domain-containing protein, partial [Candidatus Obscuribacterales bacterium]|nr:putative DNA-binding domain-containing protein [Candidatus Obscuribacterales bacterium]